MVTMLKVVAVVIVLASAAFDRITNLQHHPKLDQSIKVLDPAEETFMPCVGYM